MTFNAKRYIIGSVIRSFSDPETEKLHDGLSCSRFRAFEKVARRKLVMLDAATELRDLSRAPGNRFEPLKGKRKGEYSIRINDQFRVCFKWRKGDAFDVAIEDYH